MNDLGHQSVEVSHVSAGHSATADAPYSIRDKYYSNETSIKTIAWLNIVGGALFVAIGGLAIVLSIVGNGNDSSENTAVVAFLLLLFGGLGLWTGIGLKNLKPWARIVMSILYIPNLVIIPIGTIISGLFLWTLLNKKALFICSAEYQTIIEATPDIKRFRKLKKKARPDSQQSEGAFKQAA